MSLIATIFIFIFGFTSCSVLATTYRPSFYGVEEEVTSRCHPYKCIPTISGAQSYDAQGDAEFLKDNLGFWSGIFNRDPKRAFGMLTSRTREQRFRVAQAYKSKYDEELYDILKTEYCCETQGLVLALMTPIEDFYANELKDLVSRGSDYYNELTAILCTVTNNEMAAIKASYQRIHKASLEDDVKSYIGGDYQYLVIYLINTEKDDLKLDEYAAQTDAAQIKNIGVSGSDKMKAYSSIFGTRNQAQLRLTFIEFQKETSSTMDERIKSDFDESPFRTALILMYHIAETRDAFFATQLYDAMNNENHKLLRRVLITRSEVDLGNIEKEFNERYKDNLAKSLESFAMWNYENILLAMINKMSI